MANKRMFSLDVVDTDKFIEMPATSQNLYFHLGMRADDDLKILSDFGYAILLETGVKMVRCASLYNALINRNTNIKER